MKHPIKMATTSKQQLQKKNTGFMPPSTRRKTKTNALNPFFKIKAIMAGPTNGK